MAAAPIPAPATLPTMTFLDGLRSAALCWAEPRAASAAVNAFGVLLVPGITAPPGSTDWMSLPCPPDNSAAPLFLSGLFDLLDAVLGAGLELLGMLRSGLLRLVLDI